MEALRVVSLTPRPKYGILLAPRQSHMRNRFWSAVLVAFTGLLAVAPARGTAFELNLPDADADELTTLMERVGERVQQYYDRVTSLMCIETVTQQELSFNLKPVGKPRETVYELMVVRQPPAKGGAEGNIQVERTIKSVNGRPARRGDRPGCTDPKAVAAEPLAFLLPKHQANYRFSSSPIVPAGGPASSLLVEFKQIRPDPIDVKWEGNCFNAEGGGMKGRIWLDAPTHDVLRLETQLSEPFRVPLPASLGVGLIPPIRVERSETTIRFARVRFQDPEETLLLPESMVTVTVFRGVPSLRTTQTFRDFKRFMSEAKIKGVA